MQTNALGQAVGDLVPDWQPRPWPEADTLSGAGCRLERLSVEAHAADLFAADRADTEGRSWTYLPYGPFDAEDAYTAWVAEVAAQRDPRFYAVIDTGSRAVHPGRAAGVLSLLRIAPAAGTVEVGHIHLSPALQRTRAATEAQYLLLRYAFDELGYRRFEWKCDALNEPSRRAAQRLGFRYEGTFAQAVVVKGRNRDTAWYAIVDRDWPALRAAYEAWLDPANFDADGQQRSRLAVPA